MKRKTISILAALSLALMTASSIFAFGYSSNGSAPYHALIAAILLLGGGFTACISKLLGNTK